MQVILLGHSQITILTGLIIKKDGQSVYHLNLMFSQKLIVLYSHVHHSQIEVNLMRVFTLQQKILMLDFQMPMDQLISGIYQQKLHKML